MQVFVSPHYYYPHDHQWRFEGALEILMHNINMFDRHGPLDLQGLADSGADWLEQFKPYIDDGKAVVVSPTGAANGTFATFRGIRRAQNDIAYAIAVISRPDDVYSIDNVSYGAISVPEPSAGLLIAGTLMAIALKRRRTSRCC